MPVLSYLEPRVAESLEAHWPEIRAAALAEPDDPEALKLAARSVASPFIDETIAEVRTHLDSQDRFDLVEAAAEASEMTRAEFLVEARSLRDPINSLQSVGPTLALVFMALATVLMAVVNIPNRVSMLMWPGVTLIVAGILAIIVSAILSATLPNASYELCADEAQFACEPAVDLLRAVVQSLADLPILPPIILIILGGIGVTLGAVTMSKQASAGSMSGSTRGGNSGNGW